MSGKSWYEYKFDVIGQPGSNENGIYDIGNKYNSYDDCLSFIMEKFMEFISKQKDDDDGDKERLRVTQSVIFKTSGIIYGYLIGFLNARNEEINFKNKLKEDRLPYLLKCMAIPDEHSKHCIINILLFLSNKETHNSQLKTGRNIFIDQFNKIWTFILDEYFKTNGELFEQEQYIFHALKYELKGIPNMSTFRTQVNPKDGCVASMHAALQRSISPEMNINFHELLGGAVNFRTGCSNLVKKITDHNKKEKKDETERIENEMRQFSDIKKIPYAKATGISDTTLSSATKLEVQFGCFKLINACGLRTPEQSFINDFYNQCIISGKQRRQGVNLEDEHSLPFKVLFGVLKPEAFRVILTRMTHDLNHKFISEEYKTQDTGKPLAGNQICNASFTNRLVSQIEENKNYDEFTLYRFLFLFHAYWLANKYVLTPEEVKIRFKNLTSIKALIDLAHTEFHRNVSVGIVRPFKPRDYSQYSIPKQIQQGGTQRKTYKRQKKLKAKMKINKTKRMIGGSTTKEDEGEGGEETKEEGGQDINGVLNEYLHFDIDGDLDNRYSPEYFVLSVSSIFEALEMLHEQSEQEASTIYTSKYIDGNLFEVFKHDPHLKLLNAVIDLLDEHVDSFFTLYKKQVVLYQTKSQNPYLEARKKLIDNMKQREKIHDDSFSIKARSELLHKINHLIQKWGTVETQHEPNESNYMGSLSSASSAPRVMISDYDTYEVRILKELEALKKFIETNKEFIDVLVSFHNFFVKHKDNKDEEVTIVDLFLDKHKQPDSNNFNVVRYKVFKQELDDMLIPKHVSASEDIMKVDPIVVSPAVARNNKDQIQDPLPNNNNEDDEDPTQVPSPNSKNENDMFNNVNLGNKKGKSPVRIPSITNNTPIPGKSNHSPALTINKAKRKLYSDFLNNEAPAGKKQNKKTNPFTPNTPRRIFKKRRPKKEGIREKLKARKNVFKTGRKIAHKGGKMKKIRTQTKRNKRKGAKKNKTTKFKST